jgi:drug/metabolite transporter (DMT)-like permease
MQQKALKSDFLLLLAAFIWGTTFVAQRKGMDHIGPMTYNGLRFALGALSVLPLLFMSRFRQKAGPKAMNKRAVMGGGALAGLVLFAGASFQQVGLISTTAGKAGFVTCLYVVIVPILGLLLGHRAGKAVWIGAILAVIGLFFLTIEETLAIGHGDLLVLIGAFFWAMHVIWIGYMAKRANAVDIACIQFVVCSILCLVAAVFTEDISIHAVRQAAFPIMYGGVLSAGVGFTLQIVSQRHCPPAHAAIILSLETVFAALAGWIVLGETFTARGLLGCALMLASFMIVQLAPLLSSKAARTPPEPQKESDPFPIEHPFGQ